MRSTGVFTDRGNQSCSNTKVKSGKATTLSAKVSERRAKQCAKDPEFIASSIRGLCGKMTFKTFAGKFAGSIPLTENELLAVGIAAVLALIGFTVLGPSSFLA